MNVGLTFDLRKHYLERGFTEEETAEFDSEATIGFLEDTIRSLGHRVTRIGNVYELTRLLSAGQRWDLVFNVAEGLYGRSREAQVPAILEAFNILYTFSDPLTLALSLDKAAAKSVIRDAVIPTPDFFLIKSQSDIELLPERLQYPLFIKPIAEGTGKGISPDSIIRNFNELKKNAPAMLASHKQPVIVETYLPGKEYTVGILGTGPRARAVGVLEVELLAGAEPLVYSYMNKELCEERVLYRLVTGSENEQIVRECVDIALRSYLELGCRDAGRVDLKAGADGKIYFLEINPLAGLHPTHSDLPICCTQAGISYESLISSIIESAMERKASQRELRKYFEDI
jgi:D-alanine-D-alanine ligase